VGLVHTAEAALFHMPGVAYRRKCSTEKEMRAAISILTAMVPVTSASLALTPRVAVTADQLIKIFANGKPFASFDGTPLEMTLTPGGSVKSVDPKTKNSVTGKWRVKGVAYCSQLPGRPERCFTVDKVGSQYEFTEDGKPAGYWER
jgi:hypothetical protein